MEIPTLGLRESAARASIQRATQDELSDEQWREQRNRLLAYVQLLRSWDARAAPSGSRKR